MKTLILVSAILACANGHAADEIAAPEVGEAHMMGNQPFWMILMDRLEYGVSHEDDTVLWDAQAWYGGDYNRLYLKTEGEGATGEALEAIEFQLLYDRLLAPFWSWQTGIRHDIRPSGSDVSYMTIGLQGLAPQWFETDIAAFVSDEGDVTIRGEFEYQLLLTQRLILAPRLEFNAGFSDAIELGRASGLTSTEAGIRLRYEIRPEIAPYLGWRWERSYRGTRDIARAAGEPTSSTSLVIGIRAWL